ncbi:HEPN domain-containing protein [Shinella sp. CPCC 101442]|uniref:HEPN domain-containing protein n=1 Tax=Shinella sp. CPCC 101442 TaxID=2932265 RepID=UPI0021537EAC|nr:HEPN domain-containing protein [Shinella sp. CPCC 101442]MCR6501528.1 HEPN domain-containing protein [Shinella sp. CPCC 101442]
MVSPVFELHPSAQASIEALANDAFDAVRELDLAKPKNSTDGWWQPDNAITVTDSDIIGDPIMWLPQVGGELAFVFLWEGNRAFGFTQTDHDKVTKLIDAVLKQKWAKKAISSKYAERVFVNWARDRFLARSMVDFSKFFLQKCGEDVRNLSVDIPIQNLAVQAPFDFGPTKIMPMGIPYFNSIREKLKDINPEKIDAVDTLISKMQKDMEDCSLIRLAVFAEPSYAQDAALQQATDAVGLLRFFSVATVASNVMCPVTPLGALSVPKSHVLVESPDGISYSSGVAVEDVDYWRISNTDVSEMSQEGLAAVGALLDADNLNDFKQSVRSSILAFSRAITFAELSDRLVFAFSAIESLMLKNSSEAIQQNVAERVAFLIANTPAERKSIVDNFKKSYNMRSQYIHHRLATVDVRELDQSFENIRASLSVAVENIEKFKSKDEFLAAIEHKKFGG